MSAGKPALRRLCARQELEVLRRSPALLPTLLRYGLSAHDAIALAGNACLVWAVLEDGLQSPEEVLERFSLSEIADICEELGQITDNKLQITNDSGAAWAREEEVGG